jgi:metal-responsive CopG/Arc/MetJ family transcriptional regulator
MRQKVTYTLPVALVDKLAEASKLSNEAQSRIVENALQKELLRREKAEMDRLAEIGYSAMGAEDVAEAEADMAAWSELVLKDPWPEDWKLDDE